MLEKELYMPVKKLFESCGYTVDAEVLDCDVVAKKDDEMIIIELKTSFNLKLVYQIIKRQTYCDYVYAAIPRPNISYHSKRWKEIINLLKRLEAGLIIVSETDKFSYAQIALDPKTNLMRKNYNKKKKINLEIKNRTFNYNTGGVSRSKLMTAYRENALFIACCLHLKGPSKPKDIRLYGTGNKTASILNRNFYKWFDKNDEGFYILSEKGKNALIEYSELAKHYFDKINI